MTNLKLLRIWRGIEQNELADKAICAQSTISECESGKRNIRPKLAKKFAKALEVDLEMITQDLTLIPVPDRWGSIIKDPVIKNIIDILLGLNPRYLANLLNYLKKESAGTA